ncbi:MAG: SDR family oxidoreductase [Anaerolineae bacterium]|nr:SDR family oxidoreductase [Anaerolineae bacterium]
MDLNGKTAVVTGGAIRIGHALVLALAEAGCNVFIHYGRSAGPAIQTKEEAETFGVKAAIYSANLADVDAAERVMKTAVSTFGHIDILINNAAIFPDEDTFTYTDPVLWDKIININLRAPFLLSQAFAAQLPAQQPGKIINILDARLRRPATDHFVYRIAKGSLWQMTEMLALEVAPQITVNAVALGAILSPPGKDTGYLNKIAQERVPLQRAGSAKIVTENVLHLLHQDFLTGVIIPIDGGEFL